MTIVPDLSRFSDFEYVLLAAAAIISLALLSAVVKMLRTDDVLSRAVLADMVFYSMVSVYLIWTIRNETTIAYEIAILGALVAGVMPTISMARIMSQGRR